MIVYVVRNKKNNKGYVGLTSKHLKKRLGEHFLAAYPGRKREDGTLFPFHAAIQKYGKSNFKIELVEDNLTLETAKKRETHWIKNLKTHATAHRQGYNASWGGEELDTWHPVAGEFCPKCGNVLEVRRGHRGAFLGCSSYPECNITFSIK